MSACQPTVAGMGFWYLSAAFQPNQTYKISVCLTSISHMGFSTLVFLAVCDDLVNMAVGSRKGRKKEEKGEHLGDCRVNEL